MEVQNTEPRGRVLLVEPEKSAPDRGGLSKAFEVRSVSIDAEALKLLRSEVFDVLVLDLDLPKTDGVSFVRRLRALSSAASVVWLTKRFTNDVAAQALDVGVLQVLEKSADLSALTKAISAGVRESRGSLAVLRSILTPSTPSPSFPATLLKNEFGRVLDSATEAGAVVITRHDAAKAVLVSVEKMRGFVSKHEPDLQALSQEFDAMVARMNTPAARAASRSLFSASGEQLGKAAVRALKETRGT
jgi:prevent-host-death family protein